MRPIMGGAAVEHAAPHCPGVEGDSGMADLGDVDVSREERGLRHDDGCDEAVCGGGDVLELPVPLTQHLVLWDTKRLPKHAPA